jgi:hypothetical protein
VIGARGLAACVALVTSAASGACAATSVVEARRTAIASLARTSRERGAYRCAPEELALADAHLAFAAIALRQGDLDRAREHLVLADTNARAALRLSQDAGCTRPGERGPEAGARVRPLMFVESPGAPRGNHPVRHATMRPRSSSIYVRS